jgi:hypothetical protein
MKAKAAAVAALAICMMTAGCATSSSSSSSTVRASNRAHANASVLADAYRPYHEERWAEGGAAVTPAEVETMLANHNPQQVVNALYGTGENSRWDTVASGIANGDPAWLALAVRLSEGTDAGTSDDFAIAVGDALTTNTTGALRLMSQIEMGSGACTENGFEVPHKQALAFYEAALATVETVDDPALKSIKDACIAELWKGLGTIAP